MKKLKTPEEINYQPTKTSLLVYPPQSDNGIILLTGSNVGMGVIVAKVGPQCTLVKPGDKVMFDDQVFPINIDGEDYWQLSSEHSIFGIILNNGKVMQGKVDTHDPKNPTAHYNP